MFSLLSFAIFGLIAGAIARLLHPGRDPMGWLWTMALGIGGAVLGGWIGGLMGFNANEGLMSWVFAVLGSIALLILYHAMTRRSRVLVVIQQQPMIIKKVSFVTSRAALLNLEQAYSMVFWLSANEQLSPFGVNGARVYRRWFLEAASY